MFLFSFLPKPLINIPPHVTSLWRALSPGRVLTQCTVLSPPLLLWGPCCSPGLCSLANLVGVFSDWKAVACSPQNFALHFSISLGAAANISPAWFAGYCYKSDLGLKKISRPVKALSFYFLTRSSGKWELVFSFKTVKGFLRIVTGWRPAMKDTIQRVAG